MSALPAIDFGSRMSSRQIAEVVDARHDNVLQTIRALINGGVLSEQETPYIHPQNGQTYAEFLLTFRDTMVVASGYSAQLRAKIIDRWLELEAERRQPSPGDARIAALEARVAALEAKPAPQPRLFVRPDAADRILDFVRKRGTVTKSELLRQFRDMTAVECNAALERLCGDGRIAVAFVRPPGRIGKSGGRTAAVCRWVQ